MMEETKNLVEGLTDEILRVSEIKAEYLSLPKNAGAFAAHMMDLSINAAKKAQASGDVLEMISAYKDLKEFER